MIWDKLGRIEIPAELLAEWQRGYQMLPCPTIMEDRIRVFIGFCDANNIGRVGFVDLDLDNPRKIIGISEKPSLDIGKNGCFDDNGVVPLSILRHNKEIWLYYVGFSLGVKIPYYMFGGLAISENEGGTFRRVSEVPVLDRKAGELYARCGINVILHNGMYKMWYIGSYKDGWTMSGGKLRPLYTMMYTESKNGVEWTGESVQCMSFANEDEHGFGRPFVWYENNIYKMYYCIRTYSRGYYISYAESNDGIEWTRRDEKTGISLSKSGWDSLNMSYPYLIKSNDKQYMLYNGNGCGNDGFGVAELNSNELL